MNPICPHCNHIRKPDETAPDWQCPACGKAYAKSGSSLPPEGFRQYGAAASSVERQGGVLKWMGVLLIVAALVWFGRPLLQGHGRGSPAPAGAAQPEVVLYATEWCGYCKATREFFAANGIRYVEQDIEKSSEALARHRKLGGKGVPLILVGDEVINGYNEQALRHFLEPWLKS